MIVPSVATSLRWHLFCRVIDNLGDIGVSWRLAADLASRGHAVRLWIDRPEALAWMAPGGHPGVEVVEWNEAGVRETAPCDVVVEMFGCDPPAPYLAAMAACGRPPTWINLEYLSAQDYVERSHGLRSPQQAGPAAGVSKWFFYPGFTSATGGLLREPGLMAAQAAFDRAAWLDLQGLALASGERLASLFCYDSAPVARLLDTLAADGDAWTVATAPGAATVSAQLAAAAGHGGDWLRLHRLPWLTQADYDRLLWSCDLNFVRGEDSFVRAQWAGRPFVWQIYPQSDGAHAGKLSAFEERLLADAPVAISRAWRHWHAAWNGLETPAQAAAPLPAWTTGLLETTGLQARGWRAGLLDSADLVTQLVRFVREAR